MPTAHPFSSRKATVLARMHCCWLTFCRVRRAEAVCDLGTGCGVIPLRWHDRGHRGPCLALDIAPGAVAQLHAAVQAAEAWHITPVTADLRDLAGLHPYAQSRDVVACNPPYFTGGRVSPDAARAGARHELSCTMPDVCAAAGLLLKDGGRLCVCQRPERLADVLCAMRGARIEPKRLQFVMARPEKSALAGAGGRPEKPRAGPARAGPARYRAGRRPPQRGHAGNLRNRTEKGGPMSGTLYIVATPIGNLGDLTPRAAETFAKADFIAAEDTRVTLKLLNHLGLKKPMVSYYEYNLKERGGYILDRIEAGESCALCSDAGMPAVSDPGEVIVRDAHARGIPVVPVPAASAAVTALCVSGQPTGRFVFEGFLPTNRRQKKGAAGRTAKRGAHRDFLRGTA